ncbi:neugrin [Erythrolamprus reginae]|uniref:neugrin n=1 Tax=Erythrolamprus reginae TaxID=121349 RepID=UPI00396C4694
MKPPQVPDPRKLLWGLAAGRANRVPDPRKLLATERANEEVPALDEQLEEMERRRRCRALQTRERRLRKLMEPARPIERTLSLRAMEQIRFLRLTFPEEWPDRRLAQGFGVTPEVIRRVLKSRFCPSPERGLKQDARAAARPSQAPPATPSLPSAPELLPGAPRRKALSSGGQATPGSPWLGRESGPKAS